jgi:hypothetical protein
MQDLITIYNYQPYDPHLVFLRMWIHQINIYNNSFKRVLILSRSKEPKTISKWHKFYEFQWVQLESKSKYNTSWLNKFLNHFFRGIYEYRSERTKIKLYNHHNVRFKMWNLTQWKSPFIFLDVDAIIFQPLDRILPYLSDKPFIAINHQKIPNHTEFKEPFLNGGVQMVSKPGTFSYQMFSEQLEPLYCPGAEQALMYTTFKNLNYDYTHPKIGFEWNSCSGYNEVVKQEDGTWKCYSRGYLKYDSSIRSDSICPGVEIAVNHYWDEFKPWKLDCPMYEEFRKIVIAEETLWDKFLKLFYTDTY